MDLKLVPLEVPEGGNLILGQSHFIKTVEDIYEAIVNTVPQMKFDCPRIKLPPSGTSNGTSLRSITEIPR